MWPQVLNTTRWPIKACVGCGATADQGQQMEDGKAGYRPLWIRGCKPRTVRCSGESDKHDTVVTNGSKEREDHESATNLQSIGNARGTMQVAMYRGLSNPILSFKVPVLFPVQIPASSSQFYFQFHFRSRSSWHLGGTWLRKKGQRGVAKGEREMDTTVACTCRYLPS